MSTVDLHLHSRASDGRLRPAQVVREAARRGLVGLSLTDHDTADGIEEAAAEAARLGLEFLVGAELSANEPGMSIHILAYGFDPSHQVVRKFFREFRADRLRRASEIVERLNELGVGVSLDAVLGQAGEGVPTRAHVGRALVEGGWASGSAAAFGRYIARGRPAFVEKKPTPPKEVIDLVHSAGGVAILAHPARDFAPADIERWLEAGLDGIEVRHPRHGPAERAAFERLARERGLLRGGGSDWHGPDSGHAEIGSQEVPVSWLRAIADRCGAPSRGTSPPHGDA